MTRPLNIRVRFSPIDYPDFSNFIVPPYDEQREVLLEARVGDIIELSHEGKRYFGSVNARYFTRGDQTFPDNSDSSWSLDLFLTKKN